MIRQPMVSDSIEILLVEDNEDDIVLIEEAFAEAKLINVMFKVRDGEEALAYFRQEGQYTNMRKPGLVLLDINMPKKNGFEVLQAMKADSRLQALPVIMLTTSDRDDDVVRSYTGGACSYIRKPMTLEQFVKVVKDFEIYWTMVSRVPPATR
jgi:CheY-like chemotaxis protein